MTASVLDAHQAHAVSTPSDWLSIQTSFRRAGDPDEALDNQRLVDAQEAMTILGVKKSAFYQELSRGRLPKPVSRGPRYSRWPLHEIHAIRIAWTAAATDADVSRLVAKLEQMRMRSMQGLSSIIDGKTGGAIS